METFSGNNSYSCSHYRELECYRGKGGLRGEGMAEEGGSVGGSTLEREVEGLGGCWGAEGGLERGLKGGLGVGSRKGWRKARGRTKGVRRLAREFTYKNFSEQG
jgi:hypothetical protein